MNNKDYYEIGKSIAELNEIEEFDPWQEVKKTKIEKFALHDETEDNHDEILKSVMKEISNLQDDDNYRISDNSSQDVFWRMNVFDAKLIDIVRLQPSLLKIAFTCRNNRKGCWLAFTSERIANKFKNILTNHGFLISIDICEIDGQPLKPKKHTESKNIAENFYYCVFEINKKVMAYFVHIPYWNQYKDICQHDSDLLDDMLKRMVPTKRSWCYESFNDLIETKSELDRMGFRENIVFQSKVNEYIQ